jgi:hypothetical protein
MYWNPLWVAAAGAVFVIGRLVYFRGYIREPRARQLGFALSVVPVIALALGAAVGIVRVLSGW